MGKQKCVLCDQDVSFAVEVERCIDQSTNVFLERLKCHTTSLVGSTLYYHRDHTGLLERVAMCHYQTVGEKSHCK